MNIALCFNSIYVIYEANTFIASAFVLTKVVHFVVNFLTFIFHYIRIPDRYFQHISSVSKSSLVIKYFRWKFNNKIAHIRHLSLLWREHIVQRKAMR